jgi:hypothetical protein
MRWWRLADASLFARARTSCFHVVRSAAAGEAGTQRWNGPDGLRVTWANRRGRP